MAPCECANVLDEPFAGAVSVKALSLWRRVNLRHVGRTLCGDRARRAGAGAGAAGEAQGGAAAKKQSERGQEEQKEQEKKQQRLQQQKQEQEERSSSKQEEQKQHFPVKRYVSSKAAQAHAAPSFLTTPTHHTWPPCDPHGTNQGQCRNIARSMLQNTIEKTEFDATSQSTFPHVTQGLPQHWCD